MEKYKFKSGQIDYLEEELSHLNDFFFIEVVSMVTQDNYITLLLKLKNKPE